MSATAVAPSPALTTGAGTRRQPHRPTTYSGVSNYSTSQGGTVGYSSPIPPPRSSSQRQTNNGSRNGGESTTSASIATAIRDSLRHEQVPSSSSTATTTTRERESSSRKDTTSNRDKRAVSTQQPVMSTSTRHEKPGPARSESTREPARRRDDQSSNENRPMPAVSTRQERAEAERERNGVQTSRKETRFGDYVLGQTLGEGEFGKVKLGWRRDGGAQVAIKLIRRDILAPHPNRLSKIYREIAILRTLSHPNIVRLHEMVETERHIGIILEYASGGELFDYILTHRYLKDPPACRLFAQLVSGVGYLHKMGIVHRDLKLENLLLDRNRNIIITDFGFANVFDPSDDISDYEDRLDDPNVIKELERGVGEDGGGRRGDLMATSCGSPCYAAPELVVSDGVYTGRKVDVWSCGVILYAMLAGYLPFDDDPANPEGDNINLLYKYIVSTPLTFPEYVTPHARDLLRRILVPNPRKRADLFEVARHSWLSPFANVVGLITSSTTSTQDIATTTVTDAHADVPLLARSASVREPSTTTHPNPTATSRNHEHSPSSTTTKTSGDAKRNTVQVEYVSPSSQTRRERQPTDTPSKARRGDPSSSASRSAEKASPNTGGTKTSPQTPNKKFTTVPVASVATPSSVDPPITPDPSRLPEHARVQTVGHDTGKLPSPPNKQQQRATSYQSPTIARPPSPTLPIPELPQQSGLKTSNPDDTSQQSRSTIKQHNHSSSTPALSIPQISTRPNTGDTSTSNLSRIEPVQQAPSVKANGITPAAIPISASSRVQQPPPPSKKPFTISNPIPQTFDEIAMGQPNIAPGISVSKLNGQQSKSHKRANTVGGFSKLFGGSSEKPQTPLYSRQPLASQVRPSVDRPAEANSSQGVHIEPRQSTDQGQWKNEQNKNKRRFSFLPQALRGNSSHSIDTQSQQQNDGELLPPRKASQTRLMKHDRRPSRTASGLSADRRGPAIAVPASRQGTANNHANSGTNNLTASSSSSLNMQPAPTQQASQIPQPTYTTTGSTKRYSASGVNQSNRRRFNEAYENEGPASSGNAGSTSAARRVMDFFRKRGLGRTKS